MLCSNKLHYSSAFYWHFDTFETMEEYVRSIECSHFSLFPDSFRERHKDEIDRLIENVEAVNGFVNVNLSMLNPTWDEKMEIVGESFRRHINEHFREGIYFWDELAKHIYDVDGQPRQFDENLFQIIKQYGDEFNMILYRARMASLRNLTSIKNGDYSDGVKKLSDRCMHESLVSFEIEGSNVIARFGMGLYFGPMVCKFKLVSDDSFNVFDSEINQSEVIANPDGTFRYNALVYCKDYENHEIFIEFYDVEVTYLKFED